MAKDIKIGEQVYSFPDEMSDDDIRMALQKNGIIQAPVAKVPAPPGLTDSPDNSPDIGTRAMHNLPGSFIRFLQSTTGAEPDTTPRTPEAEAVRIKKSQNDERPWDASYMLKKPFVGPKTPEEFLPKGTGENPLSPLTALKNTLAGVGNLVQHPLESFANDPVGTTNAVVAPVTTALHGGSRGLQLIRDKVQANKDLALTHSVYESAINKHQQDALLHEAAVGPEAEAIAKQQADALAAQKAQEASAATARAKEIERQKLEAQKAINEAQTKATDAQRAHEALVERKLSASRRTLKEQKLDALNQVSSLESHVEELQSAADKAKSSGTSTDVEAATEALRVAKTQLSDARRDARRVPVNYAVRRPEESSMPSYKAALAAQDELQRARQARGLLETPEPLPPPSSPLPAPINQALQRKEEAARAAKLLQLKKDLLDKPSSALNPGGLVKGLLTKGLPTAGALWFMEHYLNKK